MYLSNARHSKRKAPVQSAPSKDCSGLSVEGSSKKNMEKKRRSVTNLTATPASLKTSKVQTANSVMCRGQKPPSGPISSMTLDAYAINAPDVISFLEAKGQ